MKTVLTVICIYVVFVSSAWAMPVRIDFSGEVTDLGDSFAGGPSLETDNPFSMGQTFSGYALYESSTAASSQTTTRSSHRGAISEFSVTYDGLGTVFWDESLVTNESVQSTDAQVFDRGNNRDRFYLTALNNSQHISAFDGTPELLGFGSSFAGSTGPWYTYRFSLTINGGSSLTPGQLPDGPYDHDIPYPADTFLIHYGNQVVRTTDGHLHSYVSIVRGELDSVTINSNAEPVPEPATMLLLGAGFLGLAGFRRRFKI